MSIAEGAHAVKFIIVVKRRAGVSRGDFKKQHEKVRASAALKRLPIGNYARNHVVMPPGAPEPGFNCITGFWNHSL